MHQVNFDLSGLHYCPLNDNASCDVFPKCDEKLSRQCRDHHLADPSTFAGDTLLEPMTEQRIRLVSAQIRRKRQPVAGCQSGGIVLLTTESWQTRHRFL